jgi:hypothetical protein
MMQQSFFWIYTQRNWHHYLEGIFVCALVGTEREQNEARLSDLWDNTAIWQGTRVIFQDRIKEGPHRWFKDWKACHFCHVKGRQAQKSRLFLSHFQNVRPHPQQHYTRLRNEVVSQDVCSEVGILSGAGI